MLQTRTGHSARIAGGPPTQGGFLGGIRPGFRPHKSGCRAHNEAVPGWLVLKKVRRGVREGKNTHKFFAMQPTMASRRQAETT